MNSVPERQIQAVDLFCGAGGLTHGLQLEGIDVRVGVDLDPACAFAYTHNNGAEFVQQSVAELTPENLHVFFQHADMRLLAGCAPCQPFSSYSQGDKAKKGSEDWRLILDFGRLVHDVQPELVTMENVPQLEQHEVFQDFLNYFEGYHTWYGAVECKAYGLPQTRSRLVLLASRLGPISLLTPEEFGRPAQTVRDTIGSLPPIKAGEQYQGDPLHQSARLSEINLKRIRASKPGGSWRDWDESLIAPCHKKKSGKTYSSVYGRMEWDKPSPTMTTQCYGFGNGRFGHPEQDRAISLREAALLQSFPASYQFTPPGQKVQVTKVGRMIGNAVPVMIGELVGRSIQAHLRKISQEATP